nr:hypothetical protein [Tanacetum cinerariifolium]
MEISDLNANLQEKGLIIAALKDDLRKLKGKALVDNVVTTHIIALEMLKIDVEPLAPRLLNNRTAHSDYLRLTQEHAEILREVVEQGKYQNPLNNSLDSACKYTKRIQEHFKLNANFELTCVKCNGCVRSDNHDLCVLNDINYVNARPKSKSIKKSSKRKVWKPTGKVVQIVLWYFDSGCSKHMTGDRSQLTNFVNKFLGLGHNLFSVRQFCDLNLEVAFRQQTCFIRNLEGVELLTGSRGNNLYTLSLGDMMASSPICLLSMASKTKSWLWHRRLSHLNFGALNHLARHSLIRGLPKLIFEKDHLCSTCAMGKSKKKPQKPKSEDTNQEKLYLLHMDLCGSMQALATACYTQNRSIIRLHHSKTPYDLLHDKLPDLSFFYVFCALCYPTNDSENLGKLQPKADIVIAPEPVASIDSPSSTIVDPDAPSVVEEENHKLDVAHMNSDPFFGISFLENIFSASSSSNVIPTVMFVDKDNLSHVYKLKKALYGSKQALRVWYDLLLKFLLSQAFFKGIVDPTLFIRRQGKDILLVEIYVDDINFAIFEKYGMESSDPVDTFMVEKSKLDEDPQGKAIDPTHYREMVGTLMYLTASRPNQTFDVCMCAWYQAKPTKKHLHVV